MLGYPNRLALAQQALETQESEAPGGMSLGGAGRLLPQGRDWEGGHMPGGEVEVTRVKGSPEGGAW